MQVLCRYDIDQLKIDNNLVNSQIYSESCQSFSHIGPIIYEVQKVSQRVQDLEIIGERGSIKSHWSAIKNYLNGWKVQQTDEKWICKNCRELLTGKYQKRIDHLIMGLNELIKQYSTVSVFLIQASNNSLKQTFGALINQIHAICKNWDHCKNDYVRINGKHGIQLVEFIENQLNIAKLQVKSNYKESRFSRMSGRVLKNKKKNQQ